ncbi:hypothetical protein B0J12DRAFT_77663 [Macrophomina phaseolina]|uniref:Zn(2)-C6 fungal-type domain-containing protein n=1 Tax=Macrophomina phaseolina TaxID=35725 RepID=A0ABQ8GC71_9PEZI|nr:hypothetical protein B0J12DRAFT_77663 [Macrophomina phaseolina]
MDSRYRTIAPMSLRPASKRWDTENSRPPKKARTRIINAACHACRRRKTKCDGERPSCSVCRKRDTECTFDTQDAEQTRAQASKLRIDRLTSALDEATRLLDYLRKAPDDKVAHIIARLRADEPPASIAASLDDAHAQHTSSQSTRQSNTEDHNAGRFSFLKLA